MGLFVLMVFLTLMVIGGASMLFFPAKAARNRLVKKAIRKRDQAADLTR